MLTLGFAPKFFRMLKKVEPSLQEEVFKALELFKNPANHRKLEVHKLHGNMRGKHAFSVNRKDRIIFRFESKNLAIILAVDDHHIYKKR